VRSGRMLIVVETKVLDETDRILATGDFSAMLVERRAPLLPGADLTDPQGPEV